jgi:pilus assembly protein CpaB
MRGQFGGGVPSQNSERTRILVLAGFFFVLLAATVGAVVFYTSSSKATVKTVVVEKAPEIKMADVLVPVQSIQAGQALEPSMFRREQRPSVGLPARVVRDFEEIKGQWSKSIILADQPLHRDYMTAQRPTNQLTVKIPDGYRAVSISVNDISSVEGWASPGAKVDVVWASRVRGQAAVTVIVENAQIISAQRQTVDAAPQGGAPVPSTITLLVTAADALKIQLAQANGSLTLSLRGDQDPGKADATPARTTTLDSLYQRQDDPLPAAPTGPRIKMRNAKGELEEYVFQNGQMVPVPSSSTAAAPSR